MNPLIKVSVLALTLVTLVNSSLLWLTYEEFSKENSSGAGIKILQTLAISDDFIKGIIVGNQKITQEKIDELIDTQEVLTIAPLCVQLKMLTTDNTSISEHCSPNITMHELLDSKKPLISKTIPVMNKQTRVGQIGWVYLGPEPTSFVTYIAIIWIVELLIMVYIFFSCQKNLARSVKQATVGAKKFIALSAHATHMATIVADNMKRFPVTSECLIMWYKHPYTHTMNVGNKTQQLRGSITSVASAAQLLCPMVQVSRSTYVNRLLLPHHAALKDNPSAMEIVFNGNAIEPLEVTKAYRNTIRNIFDEHEE
jgi:hypothetical protein